MKHELRLAILVLALASCARETADVREWRPSDHDHTQSPAPTQVDVADSGTRSSMLHGIDEVVLVAWRQNCVTCHGIIGRGDGPQAPMTRPPNLSDPAFQARVSDAELMETIRRGRGSMPAFDLPDGTIEGLVKLVRLFDANRQMRGGDAGASDAAAVDASSSDAGQARRSPARSEGR